MFVAKIKMANELHKEFIDKFGDLKRMIKDPNNPYYKEQSDNLNHKKESETE